MTRPSSRSFFRRACCRRRLLSFVTLRTISVQVLQVTQWGETIRVTCHAVKRVTCNSFESWDAPPAELAQLGEQLGSRKEVFARSKSLARAGQLEDDHRDGGGGRNHIRHERTT